MTSRIEVSAPAVFQAAFRDRLVLRLEELVSDLALPAVPELVWKTDSDDLVVSLDGRLLLPLIPQRSQNDPPLRADVEARAERVAAVLIRHSWRLLAATLPETAAVDGPAVREMAWPGLDLHALRKLTELSQLSSAERALYAAEHFPPALEILFSAYDRGTEYDDRRLVDAAVETTATRYGLPIPYPAIVTDPGLDPGTFRLRVGKLRGRVQLGKRDNPGRPAAIRLALLRRAAELFDAGSLLTLMSEPDRMPPEIARAVLAQADVAAITAALRRLLDGGIGLVDPLLIGEAILQNAVTLGKPTDLALALPGTLVVAPYAANDTPTLASDLHRRLRAKLVPAHLLRNSAVSNVQRAFLLGSLTQNRLRNNITVDLTRRLSNELSPHLTGNDDRLAVPDDLVNPLCDALTDPLPDLLVVGFRELPLRGRNRARKTVELKDLS